jgi:hypothetical protein
MGQWIIHAIVLRLLYSFESIYPFSDLIVKDPEQNTRYQLNSITA